MRGIMRSFPFYREKIKNAVENNLPEEFKNYEVRAFRVSEMFRNRDVLKIVPPKDAVDKIEATIYLEKVYSVYHPSNDMKSALDQAFTMLKKAVKINEAMTKENVIFSLVDLGEGKELLKDYPHREFHGMTILYRLYQGHSLYEDYASFITYEMAEYLGLSEEQLYENARINTKKWFPPKIQSIGESIYDMIKYSCIDKEIREGLPESLKEENDVYVLSNQYCFNASVYMLYEDVLEAAAKRIGSGYFLLPTTVYDIEIMPAVDGRPKDMKQMLAEADATDYEPGERLTDQIYYYDEKKKELSIYELTEEDYKEAEKE